MRTIKRWWWVLLIVPPLVAGGLVLWAESTPHPMPGALEALEAYAQTDQVAVTTDTWVAFSPVGSEPSTGLIFYPGGRVDPRSYAPAAREIAAEGYLAVIVPMPLNLALLAPQRAESVIEAFPHVGRWAIGGHSLGGAMAARFAYQHPSAVEGLVLWAAYPAKSNDLTDRDLAVVVIYGTLDGLATVDKINASRPLLPLGTRWVAIEGGNHGQFGWYGPQGGDNAATVSRETQQRMAVDGTVGLLESIRTGK
jgi:pimeloyl-ACP methyl ester carboxylesterase